MNSAVTETEPRRRAGPVRRRSPVVPGSTAVLVATAAADGGGAAALQPWEGTTLLARLTDQCTSLGIERVHVLTRPAWAAAVGEAPGVQVHAGEGPADDLRTIGRIAADAAGPLVVAYADVVTQREVLAGLLAEPRIATGIVSTGGPVARPFGFKTRARRGRIISAGSPYHAVRSPTGTFLGVLKVAPADRPGVTAVTERLAALVAVPSPGWQEELVFKTQHWHRMLALSAMERERGQPAPPREELDAMTLPPESAAALERRRAMAPDDVTALLLVGLIRSGVHVSASHLRSLFWARPLSPAALDRAAADILEYDEGRELLNCAVKGSDGFFTTFFVSTYSKYIARWAAGRGLTPNQVTLISAAVGVLAAAAFATGERPGMVAGALLLYAAFVLDCVDGQLARYTRQFSKLGAWLDSIFDRTKEYVVFAGLAIGASRSGDPAWLLAGAALALQTARHGVDFSYPASQHQVIGAAPQPPLEDPFDGPRPASRVTQPVDAEEADSLPAPPPPAGPVSVKRRLAGLWRATDRIPALRWIKKMIAFPIGERFAAISITAALFSAHTVFIVLLVWGGFAAAYVLIGRTLRSLTA
ncbi:MAG: CDP-alcohol phosphatidyltransferase family protein [Solirubrobacteraceae bacterium]